jgi:hypothetical protein
MDSISSPKAADTTIDEKAAVTSQATSWTRVRVRQLSYNVHNLTDCRKSSLTRSSFVSRWLL